jgi:transposase
MRMNQPRRRSATGITGFRKFTVSDLRTAAKSSQTTENFLRGHVHAFQAWNGQPRAILYDNLKSAVLERRGSHILFNPRLVELCGHYHFATQPCQVRAGNQKALNSYCTS